MGLFRGIGRLIKPLVDVKTWTDSSRFIEHGKTVYNDAKKLLVKVEQTNTETFEEASDRLGLSEAYLEKLKNKFLLTSLIFLVLGFIAAFYFAYIVTHGAWHTWAMGVVVVMLALTQFFRYHFWYYQIKSRRLGCTIKEWFKHGLLHFK